MFLSSPRYIWIYIAFLIISGHFQSQSIVFGSLQIQEYVHIKFFPMTNNHNVYFYTKPLLWCCHFWINMPKWLLEVATPWPFPRSKGQVAMFWLIWDMGRSNRSCNIETRFRDWKSENSLLYFVFCILVPSADCWRGLVDIDRQARDGDGWHGMPDRWGGRGPE